jgi:hypothetical protein
MKKPLAVLVPNLVFCNIGFTDDWKIKNKKFLDSN